MDLSRRRFLATSIASATAFYAARHAAAFGGGRGGTPGPQLMPLVNVEGEDGSKLWLRYARLPAGNNNRSMVRRVVIDESTPTMAIAGKELLDGLKGMVSFNDQDAAVSSDGALYIGTLKNVAVKNLGVQDDLAGAGDEGYIIRSLSINGHPSIVI